MEQLKHECGVALIRLRKPLEYYAEKYGSSHYALDKLYLLMQKQHNRGQEGAGVACVSLQADAGEEFLFRERKEGKNAIPEIFSAIGKQMAEDRNAFAGECFMGHLRYSTTGRSGLTYVHPHLRRSNFRKGTLALCGNFNLTNVDEIFEHLKSQGQHPRRTSDTTILLEQLGFALDNNNGDTQTIVHQCMPMWDGGFVLCGMTGTGEMFAARDPWGIRTAFYYIDDEIIVLASERPAIQTIMDVEMESITELKPGQSLFISAESEVSLQTIIAGKTTAPCSFERIYFSRGSDHDIYLERKELGRAVVPQILKAIDNDLENTVFSFIPNTAETAFFGMLEGLNDHLDQEKIRAIRSLADCNSAEVARIIAQKVRCEKVAIKDIKLRTFISESGERNELANHVYDITYGSIRPDVDNLVVIDDSIVRGTTLKQSIITILARLRPKKLIIVSSAPQIRYPDFYGIDMSNIGDLIAFRAATQLLGEEQLHAIYERCAAQQLLPKAEIKNLVSEIYEPFTDIEISQKIAQLVTPEDVKCPVEIIFQNRESLREICAKHSGDWYFTGNYPTVGGVKLLNESAVNVFLNTGKRMYCGC
ncbi:MAG: amidophosphoribosyltransferase [Bacteroidales bacterium]|jgi:amidophosphoribosyltransferase|nr:amidophosphoribosyltransferase [Bacteroidales bacterium]